MCGGLPSCVNTRGDRLRQPNCPPVQRSACSGIPDRLPSESVIALLRNPRSAWAGIRTDLLAHLSVPVLGQCLGRLTSQAVEEERLRVVTLFLPRLGDFGGLVAHGHHLERAEVGSANR